MKPECSSFICLCFYNGYFLYLSAWKSISLCVFWFMRGKKKAIFIKRHLSEKYKLLLAFLNDNSLFCLLLLFFIFFFLWGFNVTLLFFSWRTNSILLLFKMIHCRTFYYHYYSPLWPFVGMTASLTLSYTVLY